MLKILSLAALTLLTTEALAATCTDLPSCAKLTTELTQKNYIWQTSADGVKFSSSSALELNKENAEILFTSLLDQSGFTRLPLGDGKTYRIVKGVEIKEIQTPIVEASFDYPPSLPKTWDWVTMRYKTKSAETAPYIERMLRLSVPREARMQADENSSTLILTGSAPMLRHMYEMIKAADKPISESVKKKEREFQTRMNSESGKKNN